jgi:hypothetical protein
MRESSAGGHWFNRSRLSWSDGYVILLRVESALWRGRERDHDVQAILARCRREVLRELGYTMTP